jgi:threonine/homoserine/homoserine lactone efflux protein
MFLIIGLTIFFIAAFFVYETAKKNGRNAAAWTILAVCTFIGIHLILFTVFGVMIHLGIGQSIWTMNSVQYVGEMVYLIILGLSLSGVMLILLQVSRKKDKVLITEPPPPATFNGK